MIAVKLCRRCGTLKAIDEFAVHRRKRDGRQNYCRRCMGDMVQGWADRNRNRRCQHQRAYSKRHPGRRDETLARTNEKCRKEYAARKAVKAAIASGALVPEPCGYRGCGKGGAEAHHPDYDRPLYVLWRCPEHHRPIYHRRAPFRTEKDAGI